MGAQRAPLGRRSGLPRRHQLRARPGELPADAGSPAETSHPCQRARGASQLCAEVDCAMNESGVKVSVIVADDDPDIRSLVAFAAQKAGLDLVDELGNGDDAWDSIVAFKPRSRRAGRRHAGQDRAGAVQARCAPTTRSAACTSSCSPLPWTRHPSSWAGRPEPTTTSSSHSARANWRSGSRSSLRRLEPEHENRSTLQATWFRRAIATAQAGADDGAVPRRCRGRLRHPEHHAHQPPLFVVIGAIAVVMATVFAADHQPERSLCGSGDSSFPASTSSRWGCFVSPPARVARFSPRSSSCPSSGSLPSRAACTSSTAVLGTAVAVYMPFILDASVLDNMELFLRAMLLYRRLRYCRRGHQRAVPHGQAPPRQGAPARGAGQGHARRERAACHRAEAERIQASQRRADVPRDLGLGDRAGHHRHRPHRA